MSNVVNGIAPVLELSHIYKAFTGVKALTDVNLCLYPSYADGAKRRWLLFQVLRNLLAGGYGYVAGTLTGVLILGVIQTLIAFDGTLSSWWTKIVIGILLFVFCAVQRLMSLSAQKAGKQHEKIAKKKYDSATPAQTVA